MLTPTERAEARAQEEARAHTRPATTNAQRARTLFNLADDGRAGAGECIDAIERALNEAEDGGSRQPMPADADTVEALTRLVRETLEHAVGPTVAAERAANVAQVIIANFHIRLMDEDDEQEAGR